MPLGRDLIVGAIYQVRCQAHDLDRPVVRKPHMRLFGIVDWSIGSQKALIEVCESKMRRVSVPLGAPCTPPLLWFLTHAQLNVLPQHHTAENIYQEGDR